VAKKLVTNVADGHIAKASATPPMWWPSSCDRKIQRTSSGSTSEKTCSSHRRRWTGAPVSTMIGSLPRISSELTGRYWPGPAAARLGISQVSGATGTGSLAGICELVITASMVWRNRRRAPDGETGGARPLDVHVRNASGHPHDRT